jgi:hypothetical protein
MWDTGKRRGAAFLCSRRLADLFSLLTSATLPLACLLCSCCVGPQALEAMQQQAALMQTQPTESGLQGLQQLDSQEPEDQLALQQDDLQQQLEEEEDLQPDEQQEGAGEAGAGLLGGRAAALAGLGSPGAQSGSGSGSDSGSEAAELERLLAQQGIKQGTAHGGQLARLLQGARPPAAAAGETPDALKVRAGSSGRHALSFASWRAHVIG